MKKIFIVNSVGNVGSQRGCFGTLKKAHTYLVEEFGGSLEMLSKKANYTNVLHTMNNTNEVNLTGVDKDGEVSIEIILYGMGEVQKS